MKNTERVIGNPRKSTKPQTNQPKTPKANTKVRKNIKNAQFGSPFPQCPSSSTTTYSQAKRERDIGPTLPNPYILLSLGMVYILQRSNSRPHEFELEGPCSFQIADPHTHAGSSVIRSGRPPLTLINEKQKESSTILENQQNHRKINQKHQKSTKT